MQKLYKNLYFTINNKVIKPIITSFSCAVCTYYCNLLEDFTVNNINDLIKIPLDNKFEDLNVIEPTNIEVNKSDNLTIMLSKFGTILRYEILYISYPN